MRKRGTIFIYTGLLLIVAALLLTGYNVAEEQRAAASVKWVVTELQIKETSAAAQETEPFAAMQEPGEREIPDYQLNPQMDLPEQQVEEQVYIGILEITSAGLRLPIIGEWSYPALRISPCRYAGSPYTDDFVIAAHNYRSHFGCLDKLAMGEKICFTDLDGNQFCYKVMERTTLNPGDTADVIHSAWDLTLFTCTIGGQYRVVVRCEREKEEEFGL